MTELALVEVIPNKRTLDELIEVINSEHQETRRAAQTTLEHAILCGEALLEAQTLVADGDWKRWVETNASCSWAWANRYMRVATFQPEITGATSIIDACRQLTAMGLYREPASKSGPQRKLDPEDTKTVKSLLASGMSYKRVGEMFGVSDGTIRRAVDPEARRRQLRASTDAMNRRRAEKKAFAKAELEREIKKIGGDLSHTYAELRRSAQRLDTMLVAEEDTDKRVSIRSAIASIHQAETHIVQALGLERRGLSGWSRSRWNRDET